MSLFDDDVRTSPMEDTGQGPQIDRWTWLTGTVSLVGATAAGLLTPPCFQPKKGRALIPPGSRVTVFTRFSELTRSKASRLYALRRLASVSGTQVLSNRK